jgi:hypothetical protein
VKLRKLTQAQILTCGDFSLIETFQDKIWKQKGKPKIGEIIAFAERNHAIVKAALVSPTYAQIFEIIGSDFLVEERKKELAEMRKKLIQTPRGPERNALEEEIDTLRIWCDLILPEDFMSFVVAFSLGIDESDIKLVSEEMLINAAMLAERGHDNPSDHICADGRFSPFNKYDIDRRAWILLAEKRENMKNAC